MAASYIKIRSKLNRAIVAYLIQAGAGTLNDIFPENFRAQKTFPNTIAHAGIARETEPFTGTFTIPVSIVIRGSASENPGTTQYELTRKSFDERVGKTMDALMMSDDGQSSLEYTADAITAAGRALKTNSNPQIASANQDMDQFTIDYWRFSAIGDGVPAEDGSYWEEVLMFEAICRPSA